MNNLLEHVPVLLDNILEKSEITDLIDEVDNNCLRENEDHKFIW